MLVVECYPTANSEKVSYMVRDHTEFIDYGDILRLKARCFETGDVIMSRYRVVTELGRGGMGVVYHCHDIVGGIDVALKALPPEVSCNTVEMEAIRENFRLVEKLHHPNIAAAKTLEQDMESGNTYLIMELVRGCTLSRFLKDRDAPLGTQAVTEIAGQVAAALDYAHGHKVVHRDIKPSNVMIQDDGSVKILDFGLAVQVKLSLSRVSAAPSGASGTGPYMAPEQWRGEQPEAAVDQYALAVMVFELLVGHCPFEGTDLGVLREAVLQGVPRRPQGMERHVWRALRRAMAKDPAGRFDSCAELVQAMQGKSPGHPGGAGRRTIVLLVATLAICTCGLIIVWVKRTAQRQVDLPAEAPAVVTNMPTVTPDPSPTNMPVISDQEASGTNTPAEPSVEDLAASALARRIADMARDACISDVYPRFVSSVRTHAERLHMTLAREEAQALAERPDTRAAVADFWFEVARHTIAEIPNRQDLRFMGALRGAAYAASMAQPEVLDRQPAWDAVRLTWTEKLRARGLALDDYLPFPAASPLRDSNPDDKRLLIAPGIVDSKTAFCVQMLPHQTVVATRASARHQGSRTLHLSFALVPSGSSGVLPRGRDTQVALSVPHPFYMAIRETPLGALRAYSDDVLYAGNAGRNYSGAISETCREDHDYPSYRVNLHEALEFCNWLNAKHGLPMPYDHSAGGHWRVRYGQPGFRLPTTVEWEYAARFGHDWFREEGRQPWSEMEGNLAHSSQVVFLFKKPRTSAVKTDTAYPLGLYDLCGNVAEICMKPLIEDINSESQPVDFVLKGGSADSRTPGQVMPWHETGYQNHSEPYVGFRVVYSVPIEDFIW